MSLPFTTPRLFSCRFLSRHSSSSKIISPRLPIAPSLSRTTTTTTTIMQARQMSKYSIPAGSWDSHMHVTDLSRFPSRKANNKEYSAQSSTLEGAEANGQQLGVPKLVFVQVSTYGQDNSCILWCLSQTGTSRGRGVVDFDPETTTLETLREWHEAGVRGVRVNYKSVGASPSADEVGRTLLALDKAIAPLQTWSIHVHAKLDLMPTLLEVLPSLSSRLVIDHMGSPEKNFDPEAVRKSEDWKALLDMCAHDNVFVKVSAPYRFQEPGKWDRFEGLVRDMLEARDGEAVMWASDWPHTRFESTDIKPWAELCAEWCGENEELRTKLFKANAERLYDVK